MSMYREWCTDQLAVAAGAYGARLADQLVGQLGFRTAPGECGVWGRLASWRREIWDGKGVVQGVRANR